VRVHDVELRETEPGPLWDQLTAPVGRWPTTLALQVIIFDEPATADLGVQVTVVVVASIVTTRLYAPAVAGLLKSPL
jgi:hypothetical protein